MSIRSTQARAPAGERRHQLRRPGAARVSTVRLWTASVWRSSSSAPAKASGDRRDRGLVAPLGEVRDRERHGAALTQTSSSPPRMSGSPPSTLTSGSSTTQSRWTGTWTVPPIAAEAPKATWQVPRIFSSSSSSPVSFAFSFVPIPSSATLVPPSPCGRRSSSRRSPSAPGGRDQVPGLDRELDRLGDAADRGDRPVDDQRALGGALDRGDEALAARQVAEGAARGQVAGVGDPGRGRRARAAGRTRAGR